MRAKMARKKTSTAGSWGGVRQGAGREASGETPRHTRTVALNEEEATLTAAVVRHQTLAEFVRESALTAARAALREIADK